MSGFHTATPGATLLLFTFQARASAAPGQEQHPGSTIPEIAGEINRVGQAVLLRETADTK